VEEQIIKADVIGGGGRQRGNCPQRSWRGSGRIRNAAGVCAAWNTRRQQPSHAQHALHARSANGGLTDAYTENEYWADLLKVTGGQTIRGTGAPGDRRFIERHPNG